MSFELSNPMIKDKIKILAEIFANLMNEDKTTFQYKMYSETVQLK